MASQTPRLEKIKRQLRVGKNGLLWVLVSFGVGASLTWLYRDTVYMWLLAPARGQLSASGQPVFTGLTDMLGLAVRLSVIGGCVTAAPAVAYNVARFANALLSSLLSRRQRWFLAMCIPLFFALYLAGTAFAYFVLLPTAINFLLQFGGDAVQPMIRITEYLDLMLALLFWLGIVFELPLAMLLLAKMRLVSHKRFKGFRRYVPVAALILGGFITPTFDPVNQALVAVPIVLLFEVGLFLAWLVRPKAPKIKKAA